MLKNERIMVDISLGFSIFTPNNVEIKVYVGGFLLYSSEVKCANVSLLLKRGSQIQKRVGSLN